MNRMSWLLVVPLALVSALSVPAGCVEFDTYIYDTSEDNDGGSGGKDGGTDGTGGMPPQCMTVDQCPDSPECRIGGSCNEGVCEWTTENLPGTPVGAQIYGDCKRRECNALGVITQAEDPDDKYDWANPCYVDDCNAGNSPTADSGKPCTTEWGKTGLCTDQFQCRECTLDAHCPGAKCAPNGQCVPLHCANGVLDMANEETDIDCGGAACAPCAVGLKCSQRSDCEGEGQCIGSPKTCQLPTCEDTFKNGNETDVNCGGSCAEDVANPKRCSDGQGCLVPNDCATGLSCKAGICKP
ncbi:hypothetical protein [Polyangium mundeleinium]|uniref:Dickkopf N-terminal cysteine-rich domain-containing protein n=1 Tax=Polyangium mundeleinium TaxID=2995306 RepID=A0ABT5EKL9_9BACT|nr:hypothetical protein [Polyangium mundeleinium]MDC0742378.1 hypothetical protein [Polyangium mundeleinium]